MIDKRNIRYDFNNFIDVSSLYFSSFAKTPEIFLCLIVFVFRGTLVAFVKCEFLFFFLILLLLVLHLFYTHKYTEFVN